MQISVRVMLMSFVLSQLACGTTHTPPEAKSSGRDWSAYPAIVSIERGPDVYAVSDVHGGYDRLVALLSAQHVIAAAPSTPDAARWTAGSAVLVVAGDLFDKGPKALEVLTLLESLEGDAKAHGGRVVVTFGNHEAEFLDDPHNKKASGKDGVDAELETDGIDPLALADGTDPRGAWLRNRPFGVRVGRWFFSHAGNSKGRSIAELEATLRSAVNTHEFGDDEIIGDDSLLEAREWYAGDDTLAARYAAALGVQHIVFGHQPSALGPKGEIALSDDASLFRIDCGMSPDVDDSDGRMLRIRVDGHGDIAESLSPDGSVNELWRESQAP